MPTRTLDGVDDLIVTAIGPLNFAFGPGTLAAIVRRTRSNVTESVIYVGVSATTGRYALEFGNAVPRLRCGASIVSAASITVSGVEGWVLIAATKATGGVAPRFHKYDFATGTWTHENAGSTLTNSGTPGTSARIGATNTPSQWFAGEVAIAAVSNTVLSDVEIETLVTEQAAWDTAGFVTNWPLDQASTATAVQDTIGAADQTSLTGTTVSADEVPWTGNTTPVSATFTGTVEATGSVVSPVVLKYESVIAIASGHAASLESVIPVSRTTVHPVDVPQWVAPLAAFASPVEALAAIGALFAGQYETQSVETINATFSAPWDAPQPVTSSTAMPWEVPGRITSATAATYEALAPVRATRQIPIEAGGEARTVAPFEFAYEATKGVSNLSTGSVDTAGPVVSVTHTLPGESLAPVRATRQVPIEAGGAAGIAVPFAFVWEATGAVTRPVSAPYESAPGRRVKFIRPSERAPDLALASGTRTAELTLVASTRTPTLTLEVT